jgi:hypothetical protein
VTYRTREHWLLELLVTSKDDFVLKPGEGFASDGVLIGKNTSPFDWERAVASALDRGTWVAQERLIPRRTTPEAGRPEGRAWSCAGTAPGR